MSGVEIHDFPTAEDFKQLGKLMEIAVVGRWPGFRLINKKKIRAKDKTMPDGFRPGLDMTFTTEYQGKVYTVRNYALFCRWHKRTYDFLSIVAEDKWKSYEETVETTSQVVPPLRARAMPWTTTRPGASRCSLAAETPAL